MNTIIATKDSKKIYQKQVDYILKGIIDYTFSKIPIKKPIQKKTFTWDNTTLFLLNLVLLWPKMLNLFLIKQISKIITQHLLEMLLNSRKLDSRLMIKLRKNWSYKNKHFILLQKLIHKVLPQIWLLKKLHTIK